MNRPKFYTSFRTALFAGIFTTIVFVGLFLYLGISQREFLYKDSKQIAEDVARRATVEIQEYFTTSLMVARSLTQRGILLKNMNADRQEVVDMLHTSLSNNPNFLSIWTMWEHNAYDGKDVLYAGKRYYDEQGNLSTTFFWSGDSILIEQTRSSDYQEDFYTLPTKGNVEFINEPYFYQYKGDKTTYYETIVAVPIRIEAKVLGVFAVDIDLNTLQQQLSEIKPYGTGFVSLISSQGHIIYHPDTTLITKNFFNLPNPENCPLKKVFTHGSEYMLETVSSFSGLKVFRFFYPIHIGYNTQPWVMMVEIPIRAATYRTTQLLYVTIIFAVLSFMVLLFLLLNIIDRRKYDQAVSDALKEAEEKNQLALESSQDYEQIFNSTNEAILVVDDQSGKILDVNDAMLSIYGYSSITEVLNLCISDFYNETLAYNTTHTVDYFKQAATHGQQTFEWKSKKKNGELFWVEITFKKVRISGYSRILTVLRDINENKDSRNALEKSEKRFREISDLLPQSIWEANLEGRYLYANQAGYALFGFEESDIEKGVYMHDVLSPESCKEAIERIGQAISSGKIRDEAKNGITYYAKRKDGTIFPVEVFYNLILSDGKPIGIRGVTADITERIKAENALKESKQLFETLASASPVGIFRTDAHGKTTYVNPTWCSLSGLSFEEALGDSWQKALHPDDRVIVPKWEENHQHRKNSVAEYRFLRPDGTVVWVLGSALPELDNGSLKGYVGTITNITETKKAEQELKESKERYQAIMEALPDIVMVCDPQFNIVYGNDALERVLGVQPKDYSNVNRIARIHPEDASIELREIDILINSNRKQSRIIEIRFFDSKGNLHWFSEIISKITFDNQVYLQIIARDITEKKLIESELIQYREKLEVMVATRTKELEQAMKDLTDTQSMLIQSEKMASLGVLTAGIAHEINNPLNFIQGGALGLQNFIDEFFPEYKSKTEPLLNAILEGVSRSASIVRSLNRYSRKDETPMVPCSIHTIIDSCLVMVNSEVVNRITINKNYCCEELLLLCKEGKIHQAILNILVNAINSIESKGTISITTLQENEMLKLIIADTGCGISKENLNRITDPFFTTKPPGSGTGLGLSITYTIIADHNGYMEFESELNKGTTVTIVLPFKG